MSAQTSLHSLQATCLQQASTYKPYIFVTLDFHKYRFNNTATKVCTKCDHIIKEIYLDLVKEACLSEDIFSIGDLGGPKGWLVMKLPGYASAWPASASASASACLEIVQGQALANKT